MADITMCSGKGCPNKDRCHRHTATPGFRQSQFTATPIKEDGTCDHYWPTITSTNEHFSTEENTKSLVVNAVYSSSKIEGSTIAREELNDHYDELKKKKN